MNIADELNKLRLEAENRLATKADEDGDPLTDYDLAFYDGQTDAYEKAIRMIEGSS